MLLSQGWKYRKVLSDFFRSEHPSFDYVLRFKFPSLMNEKKRQFKICDFEIFEILNLRFVIFIHF